MVIYCAFKLTGDTLDCKELLYVGTDYEKSTQVLSGIEYGQIQAWKDGKLLKEWDV